MQKSIEGKPIWRWIAIYIFTVGIGYLLFPAAWGGMNAIMLRAKVANLVEDPSFREELLKILTKEELKRFDVYNLHKLPEEKKIALQLLLKKRFKETNWLPIHLAVNAVSFAVLGSILGLFFVCRYAALIPIGLLLITLPSLSADVFRVHTKWLTISIGLVTQLASVYLFSFVMLLLRKQFQR